MSQTLVSQYGGPTLVVDDETPTVALKRRLGQTHVMTADREVVRMVWDAMKSRGYSRRQRHLTLAAALWIHRENRACYLWVCGSSSRDPQTVGHRGEVVRMVAA